MQALLDAIEHRGPDGQGTWSDRNCVLGHRRLSILDVSNAGAQPMSGAGGRYTITFNGEVYNFVELREELSALGHMFHTGTDTEVILAAWAEWGELALPRFVGMFAFAIHDAEAGTMTVVRDPFGIKPVYWLEQAGVTWICSEIKGLLAAVPEFPRIPNRRAVGDYLVYGVTDHTDETFFEGIFSIPPGHVMRLQPKSDAVDRIVQQWYHPELGVQASKDPPTEFRKRFKESVAIHLRSDVPLGFCVSGGLDSSSIVTAARSALGPGAEMHGFSAVFPGSAANEEPYIDAIARHTHIRLHKTTPDPAAMRDDLVRMIYHQDEPVAASSDFAHWAVMRAAAKAGVKVLLDGQGPDEYLGGYYYFYSYHLADLLRGRHFKEAIATAREVVQRHGRWEQVGGAFYHLQPKAIRRRAYGRVKDLTPALIRPWHQKSTYFEDVVSARTLYQAMEAALGRRLQQLLHWEDRNSMAFSIETRLPFLDHRLVEYGRSLPTEWKIQEGITKRVAREAMAPDLPESVNARRTKQGFDVDTASWLAHPGNMDWARELLLGRGGLADRNLVRRKVIQHALARQQRRGGDATNILHWLKLEIWFRTFIDPPVVSKPTPELRAPASNVERIERILADAKARNYESYDPYDPLTSPAARHLPGWARLLLLQSGPYLPFNARPMLKVKQAASNKAIALYAQANLEWAAVRHGVHLDEGVRLAHELWKHRLDLPEGPAWNSYHFTTEVFGHRLAPDIPDIMTGTRAPLVFLLAYARTGDAVHLNRARQGIETLERLFLATDHGPTYVRYTPGDKQKVVHNVQTLYLELRAAYAKLTREPIPEHCWDILTRVLDAQAADGSWPYSYYWRSGRSYRQIDYHQGFIIDGLRAFLSVADPPPPIRQRLEQAIASGVQFYANRQFRTSGRPLYRLPVAYPTCAHNAAQGIITFAADLETRPLAIEVRNYADRYLWDEKLQAYCQRWPGKRIRIRYLRWAQAWMVIGLIRLYGTTNQVTSGLGAKAESR